MDKKFQAFLINMKHSTERYDFMARQLEKIKIPFEIQEGINGKTYNFDAVYDEFLAIRLNGSPLTLGEKGCALSHRLILEKMRERDLDYALIMEDDIELPTTFKENVECCMKKNEEGSKWEYISFNYPYVGIRHIRVWLFQMKQKIKKERKKIVTYISLPLYGLKFLAICCFALFEGVREKIYKSYYPNGDIVHFYRPLYYAGCYLITRSGMEKILSINEKIVYPADRIQNIARIKKRLRFYAFCPMLVTQRRDRLESTIEDTNISAILDSLV